MVRYLKKQLGFLVIICCIVSSFNIFSEVIIIPPSENSQDRLQEALILANPGDTIQLTSGVYNLEDSLSLDVDNIIINGDGHEYTILNFSNQMSGAQGLMVTSDNVTLKDFAVLDAKGDAIKVKGSDGISFINIRTEWSGGPKSTNGAYGLYPVESKNVLIDGCIAIGASDAGIYVGQSENIIVRNSIAKFNVAGIEIENSYYADVYSNTAEDNTGGILVFDLPGLPQQGGHDVRVFDNLIQSNNTDNFAPEGNIVGEVPRGTGIIIMANSDIEIFDNQIQNHETLGIAV
ncbi:MAG TPA: parallel beta-helix domain-containing protein, partial [Gammaproteobacteria bacterium]|nr:parallel beta-helix domain-containing protein [Gammaproteobacteria bacterium]